MRFAKLLCQLEALLVGHDSLSICPAAEANHAKLQVPLYGIPLGVHPFFPEAHKNVCDPRIVPHHPLSKPWSLFSGILPDHAPE